jgi:prepilin-type N-terminal cleavage/methylation domain-containing protein
MTRPDLSRQRGFTLMEVMASTVATAIVIAAASAFLLKFLTWYDELSAKIAINRHARETYELLSLGGRASTTGNDGTKNLYGWRERFTEPNSSTRNNYALRFRSNNLTLTPDRTSSMSITCTGDGTPMPDCNSSSGAITVAGWIGSAINTNIASRSISGRTMEVTFTIMNPFQIQRANSPAFFAENYRAIFTLNREEDDP